MSEQDKLLIVGAGHAGAELAVTARQLGWVGSIDLIGEDILMYASDYPHRESWFPKSVETVMAWDMPDGMRRKFLWDNAVRNYSRYSAN